MAATLTEVSTKVPALEDYFGLSEAELYERIEAARKRLGPRLVILGHHYQRDDVICHADITGDSFKLSKLAAERPEAEFIVFCGVHFMAESADILKPGDQKVVLPDLGAGCSMADMATAEQVEDAWEQLASIGILEEFRVAPVTYMNSSAAIKAFCGRNGGVVCTSSNAVPLFEKSLKEADKLFFFPDQHLGRNTAVLQLGLELGDCVVWDPHRPNGGLTTEQLRAAKMLLWKGHCSVHGRFSAAVVDELRETVPGINILVHPECSYDVVTRADLVGSTEFIIKTIEAAPAGSSWAIGTELNLVQRLANAHPDKSIVFLDKTVCYCSTMNRIDLPHFVWAMESLVAGTVVNHIQVDPDTEKWALVALQRMLDLPGKTHRD